ncbi:hypothetical protein ASE00_00995 [Sphingomonas sp. Root710]|uniref:ergothioneine biosynthesis protein EgtB n=1 Tax=Sphingomonas sp. Root710 TaxID=1736594 RepID=UPI0006F7039C|nr:ergothioneine biosynthesis protein EgtB [Sphingomonas sp. Root710]KRB85410.1 hypothetical protein ASE00_00995 [Sphingomonas sp. Root710]
MKLVHHSSANEPGTPSLAERYRAVRRHSERLAAPLSAEDCQLQSMPDASPVKWHLAHISWFFETFLLIPHLRGYQPLDPAYATLFNSYYVGVGDRHPRAGRGMISRPSLEQVMEYRRHVDQAMARLIGDGVEDFEALVELGLQHEQQHQELILMDIQHALSESPGGPVYAADAPHPIAASDATGWSYVTGGLHEIGDAGGGFAFDNEGPRHRVWLEDFEIARALVTTGDYLAFMGDGGYDRPELWLSDGWAMAQSERWEAPLYWRKDGGAWTRFSLRGRMPIDPAEPVLHLSYYEADAYARWRGARLPREEEWEIAASLPGLVQRDDSGWQWTASPYVGYPGYRAPDGAIGEYNGKFMVNQIVLRGGCLATPPGHARLTYRNFYPPAARWMLSAIRLARDV